MKVKCVKDKISELPTDEMRNWVRKYHCYDDDHHLHCTKGCEYIVYGIHFYDNRPFYFLCDEETNEYPILRYAGFFEVVDDRISPRWKLSYQLNVDGSSSTALLHKDWADDPMFYENLVEGEAAEKDLFQKYKKEMDKEAGL